MHAQRTDKEIPLHDLAVSVLRFASVLCNCVCLHTSIFFQLSATVERGSFHFNENLNRFT